jgi:site-specific DNA recombinase
MTRVAIYARVSSDRQEKEETVQSQLAALREHAQEKGYEVIEEYVDEGYSGATLARPRLERLRDDARAGRFEKVLVHSLDRLARKLGVQYVLFEEWEKEGVAVELLHGQPEDNPEGQLLLGMQGIIAEYEREKISERTRRGKQYWAKQGALMGGYVPFGYRYVPRDGEHRATLAVHEAAATVREMFRLLIEEKLSCRGIARTLTDRAIPTPGGGEFWRESTVNRILRNPTYKGIFLYRRNEYVEGPQPQPSYRRNRKTRKRPRPEEDWIEVAVPPVVDPDTWELAQRRLAENSRFAPRNNKRHEYLLKGLVRCGRCGAAMSGAANHGKRRYCCSAFDPQSTGKDRLCPRPSRTGADELEAAVWGKILEVMREPDILRQAYENRLAQAGGEDAREQELRAEVAGLKRQQERLLDLYQSEQIERAGLDERLAKLNRRRREAAAELEQWKARRQDREQVAALLTAFRTFFSRVSEGLEDLGFADRQRLVRLLVNRVVVDLDGGNVRIEFTIPLPADPGGPEGTQSVDVILRSMGGNPGIQGGSSVLRRIRMDQDGSRGQLLRGDRQDAALEPVVRRFVLDPLLPGPVG